MKVKEKNCEIEFLGHATFRIFYSDKIIYIDPYMLDENPEKADFVFVTHEHFDHLDLEKIETIKKDETKIIIPKSSSSKVPFKNKVEVEPNKIYNIEIKFETVPAYNLAKRFHPKEKNWVGYVLHLDDIKIYHAGDTDYVPEMKNLKNLDYALIPVGGYYTMDYKDAINFANEIKPKNFWPIHFNTFPEISLSESQINEIKEKIKESKIIL